MELSHYHIGDAAERPWGCWEVLGVYPKAILKQIRVKPGCRLSLQGHRHRDELWTVVQGRAVVEIDGHRQSVAEGGSVTVPRGCRHRLGNDSQGMLVVIEIQRGDLLSEDDIKRYEDDYHRAPDDELTR